MNTDEENALTERVIGAILEVSNTLGAEFLENCTSVPGWGNSGCAASVLLPRRRLPSAIRVSTLENYYTDILVEDVLVVERSVWSASLREHVAQCLNYLRGSRRRICLLVNFPKPSGSGLSRDIQLPESLNRP